MAFTFTTRPDEPLTLETAVFEALGAASVCWEDMSGTSVFQSEQAEDIGHALIAVIRAGFPPPIPAESRTTS